MIPFDITNWYWFVGGNTDTVFSSQRSTYVSVSDSKYQAWINDGGQTSEISNADMLVIRILILEARMTLRRMREAGSDDAGGNAAGRAWMSALDAEIVALREALAQL